MNNDDFLNDIEFTSFRRSRGKGGQHANKTSCAIRAIHLPTGIKVEVCSERSLSENKKRAISLLRSKIEKERDKIIEFARKEKYKGKPNASFGEQIRTYKLCGDKKVIDHRTETIHNNINDVLNGDIDIFVESFMKNSLKNQ